MALAAAAVLALALALLMAAFQVSAADMCTRKCGSVSVPYPFGIGPAAACSLPGFNLTCDTRSRLLLGDGTLRVVNIFIANSTVRVVRTATGGGEISIDGDGNGTLGGGLTSDGPYRVSFRNELVVVGCDVMATLRVRASNMVAGGCASVCIGDQEYLFSMEGYRKNDNAGLGFCRANIYSVSEPDQSYSYDVRFTRFGLNHTLPSRVFVAEGGWFDSLTVLDDFTKVKVLDDLSRPAMAVPLILDWEVLGYGARPHACPRDTAGRRAVCKSNNSVCSSRIRGFVCSCQHGYEGNPYVADGCTDVKECEHPEKYGCYGECRELAGSFQCWCPKGSHGNHSIPGGCVKSANTGLVIGIGVAIGASVIIFILIALFIIRMFKHQREEKLKKKFFKQNRGQLLEQLVSQRADIAERMIIPLEELKKATNNFDKARVLGRGGHGMVYKGILSDLHVVAIKKPKMAVQKEIDEFINEVAILSQINHRNVVKLHGCCLETEVPMLVYEFISNGTLFDHLHVTSLSWKHRLRIATETAKSLAYLHSAVSVPIIHRDIKSANILLDDTLTAKVADFGASRYIPIEKTALTTTVQGTLGYLDPMYFYTWRLTENSDVYSFGIILIELLTRKKPFSYVSPEGDGLAAHFVTMFVEGNLIQILDPLVIDDGGEEVRGVAALAVSCVKLKGEDRPTMRQVEWTLEGFQEAKNNVLDSTADVEFKNTDNARNYSSTKDESSTLESTRQYSMEEEFNLSARYPR
uniref:Uncharacterized protein n=1 Tax=Avena sativa TaxID=4498 RepID=A0ACD5ZWS9_AVESA